MSIFYPEKDIHVQWPGVEPLDYHYLAIKDSSVDKYIYYNYDGKPEKRDIYGISLSIPLDTTADIEVYFKCKAKAGSYIGPIAPQGFTGPWPPNDSHFVVNLGYDDGIINEVYASKDYSGLTEDWQEFSSLVALNQPRYFHHYHSLAPTPGREEEFWLHHNRPDIHMCEHTIIHHAPPPAILSSQQIRNEINYISITGFLVDPSAYLYVAWLVVEVIYV